jgi:hypothetical protein
MRTFGIIHFILFLLLLLVYQCTSAQDFLVTIKGDTLLGTVKILYGPDKKVQVAQKGKSKTTLHLFQVSYYNQAGEIFKPVKGPAGYTFMKLVKSGYLSLYAFQMENQTTYDGMFLVKKDGQSLEVPNLNFKKMLKGYLSDCPDIVIKIDQGEYPKKDLEKLIDDYNACIENKSVSIQKATAVTAEKTKKINSWDVLEEKVKAQSEFEGKTNALEMITEIKSKISKGEKVPNFLLEGLKSSLPQPELQEFLQSALTEIK